MIPGPLLGLWKMELGLCWNSLWVGLPGSNHSSCNVSRISTDWDNALWLRFSWEETAILVQKGRKCIASEQEWRKLGFRYFYIAWGLGACSSIHSLSLSIYVSLSLLFSSGPTFSLSFCFLSPLPPSRPLCSDSISFPLPPCPHHSLKCKSASPLHNALFTLQGQSKLFKKITDINLMSMSA